MHHTPCTLYDFQTDRLLSVLSMLEKKKIHDGWWFLIFYFDLFWVLLHSVLIFVDLYHFSHRWAKINLKTSKYTIFILKKAFLAKYLTLLYERT